MGTEMEVIFPFFFFFFLSFPLCLNKKKKKMGKKAISSVQKASCHFASSSANRINKNIGLCRTLYDRGGSLILM